VFFCFLSQAITFWFTSHTEIEWAYFYPNITMVWVHAFLCFYRAYKYEELWRTSFVFNKLIGEAKLEKAESELKSAFLANMSHEMRTPLNGIMLCVELIKDDKLTKAQAELFDTLHQSSEALLRLVNDTLDFSKLEAGKFRIKKQDMKIQALVDYCMNFFAPLAIQKGLELYSIVDPHCPETIFADSDRLKQVLMNFLSNAIKFTSSGSIGLRIHIVQGTDIRFSVIDTGLGINQGDLKKLFISFSQLDSSYSKQVGGLGLGLAISKALVELMEGQIGVTSEEKKGSTFWFTIKIGNQLQRLTPEIGLCKTQKVLIIYGSDYIPEVFEIYLSQKKRFELSFVHYHDLEVLFQKKNHCCLRHRLARMERQHRYGQDSTLEAQC